MTHGVSNSGLGTIIQHKTVETPKDRSKTVENQHTQTVSDSKQLEHLAKQGISTDEFVQNNKKIFNQNNSSNAYSLNENTSTKNGSTSFFKSIFDSISSKIHNAWQSLANTLGLAQIELPPERLEGLSFTLDNKVMQLLVHDRLVFESANKVLLEVCRNVKNSDNEVLQELLKTKIIRDHVKTALAILKDVNDEETRFANCQTKPPIDSFRMGILEVASLFNYKVKEGLEDYNSWTPKPQ